MNKIFCLETEWDQTKHDLKMKSAVLPLLEFAENKYNLNVGHIFRQVATPADFNYYIEHLYEDSYKQYDSIYLCFHGTRSTIHFANKEFIDFDTFGEKYPGIFEGRNVHLGCCYTLGFENDVAELKANTGARMITGYTKSVSFMESFIFELWLLKTLKRHDSFGPKRLMDIAVKEMPYYTKKLGFVAY